MSINFVRFLQELDIVNEGVQSFVGERCYMATGDLSNEDTNELELVTYENKPSRAALTAKPGDVIFARMKGTNKVLLVTEKESNYIFSTGFVVIRSSENVNKSFLTHFLKSNLFQDEKDKLCTGATQKAINNQNIEKLKFLLLPLATQKRIAEILDAADALRRKDQELLKKYDELAQAIFIDMFGDPVKNEKGWDFGTIRDVATEVKYGTSKPAEEGGRYPYLRMNNITYEGDWDFKDLKYINLNESEKNKYLIKKGDLVFNRTNSKELVGKTAVYNQSQEMAIAGYLIRVRTNEKANSNYISAYLNSKHGKKTLLGMCKSIIGMANINAQELQDISIMIPPIELQNKFSQIVRQIEQLKIKIVTQKSFSENVFNSSIQKAFKGELVS